MVVVVVSVKTVFGFFWLIICPQNRKRIDTDYRLQQAAKSYRMTMVDDDDGDGDDYYYYY